MFPILGLRAWEVSAGLSLFLSLSLSLFLTLSYSLVFYLFAFGWFACALCSGAAQRGLALPRARIRAGGYQDRRMPECHHERW